MALARTHSKVAKGFVLFEPDVHSSYAKSELL